MHGEPDSDRHSQHRKDEVARLGVRVRAVAIGSGAKFLREFLSRLRHRRRLKGWHVEHAPPKKPRLIDAAPKLRRGSCGGCCNCLPES